MKLYWRALLLAAVFILALIVMRQRGSDEEGLHLWDIEPTQLRSVKIMRDGSLLEFEYRDKTWQLKADEALIPLDEEKWSWRLKPLLHPHADSRLDVDGSNGAMKERYGLAQPLGRLWVSLQNGEDYQMSIGRLTALQRHYYVQMDDNTDVYLLAVSTLAPLLKVEKKDVIQSESTQSPADTPAVDFLVPAQSPPQ